MLRAIDLKPQGPQGLQSKSKHNSRENPTPYKLLGPRMKFPCRQGDSDFAACGPKDPSIYKAFGATLMLRACLVLAAP